MGRGDSEFFRFAEAVVLRFDFLREHGLRRVRTEPTLVKYESESFFVSVYYGRRSFEIGLEVGPVPVRADEGGYSISEITTVMDPEDKTQYRNYTAVSQEQVATGVERLALLFRRCVNAGILQETDLIDRLRESRRRSSHEYASMVKLAQVRQQAEAEWHAKNYGKVVELLRPFRALLTIVELQKLQYAEKHQNG